MKSTRVALLLFVVSCFSAFAVTAALCAVLRRDEVRPPPDTCSPSSVVVADTNAKHDVDVPAELDLATGLKAQCAIIATGASTCWSSSSIYIKGGGSCSSFCIARGFRSGSLYSCPAVFNPYTKGGYSFTTYCNCC